MMPTTPVRCRGPIALGLIAAVLTAALTGCAGLAADVPQETSGPAQVALRPALEPSAEPTEAPAPVGPAAETPAPPAAEPAAPQEQPEEPAEPAPGPEAAEPPTEPAVEEFGSTTVWVAAPAGLVIREGASIQTAKVGTLADGTTVEVNARSEGFLRLADGRGWISGRYTAHHAPAPKQAPKPVAAQQPAPEPSVAVMPDTVMYTSTALNLRSGPGVTYSKAGSLPAGGSVTVNGESAGFYRLADGRWASALYLSTTQPKAPAPAGASQSDKVAWTTRVANVGGQAEVDACTGGLTDTTAWTGWGQGLWLVAHRGCGGAPLLALRDGDLVKIDGALYVVTGSTSIPYPGWTGPGLVDNGWGQAYSSVAQRIGGSDIYVQTCWPNHSDGMRVVALKRA